MQAWEELAYARRDGREQGREECRIDGRNEKAKETEAEKKGAAAKLKICHKIFTIKY